MVHPAQSFALLHPAVHAQQTSVICVTFMSVPMNPWVSERSLHASEHFWNQGQITVIWAGPKMIKRNKSGKVRLDIKNRFCTSVWWVWNRLPRVCHGTKLAIVQAVSGQLSQTYRLILGRSCVEPGVGINNPCGSLPTLDTLWIHNSPLVKMGKYLMSPVGCQNSKVLISLKAKGQNLRDQAHISAFILIIYRQKLRFSSVMGSFFLSCLQNSCTWMHKAAECSSASFVHTNTTKGKHLHFGEKKQIDFQKKYGGRKPQWYQTLSFGGALKVKATKYPF